MLLYLLAQLIFDTVWTGFNSTCDHHKHWVHLLFLCVYVFVWSHVKVKGQHFLFGNSFSVAWTLQSGPGELQRMSTHLSVSTSQLPPLHGSASRTQAPTLHSRNFTDRGKSQFQSVISVLHVNKWRFQDSQYSEHALTEGHGWPRNFNHPPDTQRVPSKACYEEELWGSHTNRDTVSAPWEL